MLILFTISGSQCPEILTATSIILVSQVDMMELDIFKIN